MQLMVKQCQFNEHHSYFARELQTSLLHLVSCQSTVISSLMSSSIITRDKFDGYLNELREALDGLRIASKHSRLAHVQHVLESAKNVRSEDHFSHSFFLFQLGAVTRLIKQATLVDQNKTFFDEIKHIFRKKSNKKRRTVKEVFKPQWPRFVSAFKSTVTIGVGSIFVMVPRLAETFENGQWILIALCMTQGDTVGGALTTMKMRLLGTLLGMLFTNIELPLNSFYLRSYI